MFKRKDRHSILINLSEHCVQLARIRQDDSGPLAVDRTTELPAGDEDAIAGWIRGAFPEAGNGYLPAYCTFFPPERLIMREAVNTRRLAEPGYLTGLIMEHAKVSSAKEWHVNLLNPYDGMPLTPESTQRTGLIVGIPWTAVRAVQQLLKQLSVRPRQLEIGTITALGGLSRQIGLASYPDGVAVCEIARNQTRLYLIGKDGVHTPPALPHGLLSIEEAAMKELGAPDIVTTVRELEKPTENLVAHGRRLVRMLSRHLRPAIDYFEMQTGQRIGALFCGHLPSRLAWLEDSLIKAVDLDPFPIDLPAWMSKIGLRFEDGVETPPLSWLPLLSAVGDLAPETPAPATAAVTSSMGSSSSPGSTPPGSNPPRNG